ncbi:MAG: hypothetical protein QME74_08745, partial [Candidatus Edwardsbacteria bacterium]|nr:hypothetical protein [Candidatus Edwardsbacteria bacterium]
PENDPVLFIAPAFGAFHYLPYFPGRHRMIRIVHLIGGINGEPLVKPYRPHGVFVSFQNPYVKPVGDFMGQQFFVRTAFHAFGIRFGVHAGGHGHEDPVLQSGAICFWEGRGRIYARRRQQKFIEFGFIVKESDAVKKGFPNQVVPPIAMGERPNPIRGRRCVLFQIMPFGFQRPWYDQINSFHGAPKVMCRRIKQSSCRFEFRLVTVMKNGRYK